MDLIYAHLKNDAPTMKALDIFMLCDVRNVYFTIE